jgi:L-alanine-DL-glutamate epimerase-like enolase superfamily enzyme
MRIVAIEIYGYDVHYAHGDYVMSHGRTVTALPSTLVRVLADDGLEGWGEACPLGPTYLDSFADGVRAALPQLAAALIGIDPCESGSVNAAMDGALRGQRAAKSALDVACWDLFGRRTGLPVCVLLGGRRVAEIPLYSAVPLAAADEMVAFSQARIAEGIRALQLKLGGDPREDAGRVRAVRDAVGDDVLIVADANGGWRPRQALEAARRLGELDRLLLEQPCPTLEECLQVRALTTLPMSLDEVIVDAATLARAASVHAMEAINLKIGRVGGLTAARAMRDLADALGVGCVIEDSWGGDVVTAAVSHLAASTAPQTLIHASFMNDWVTDHVAGHRPRSRDGRGAAPDAPGLGIEVERERLGPPLATVTGDATKGTP